MRVLIVDDQASDRLILRKVLQQLEEVEVVEADGLSTARRLIRDGSFDAAIIDLRLGDDIRNRDGHALIRELGGRAGPVPIVWTATREIHEIREAMRNGAYDYIFKDAPHKELVARVIEGLRTRQTLQREVLEHRARRSLDQPLIHDLVGDSVVMARLREEVQAVAVGSDKPVLILGPSGSGKELVARGIHALGRHPEASFVAKNCAAIPETLFESELFGHEEQAFTGARRRAGALGSVGHGTLFLDEIGELPLAQQAKLLRVLESRRYTPLGSDTERVFNGRIVAATLVDLEHRLATGLFRRDLYMRLAFFPISLPSLQEHTEDIPAIVEHYMRVSDIRSLHFSAAAYEDLKARPWPGNVRQLQQVIERLAIRAPASGSITPEHIAIATKTPSLSTMELIQSTARVLMSTLGTWNAEAAQTSKAQIDIPDELVAALFREALARCEGKKAPAARLLGTDRRVIERFLRRDASDPAPPNGHED